MAHKEQVDFCSKIRDLLPDKFTGKNVLDAGSLDINGNNRFLFDDCNYIGIDLGHGSNVDIAMPIATYLHDVWYEYDVIVSTEMLEHDRFARDSMRAMYNALKLGGVLLLTAAGINRPEHGTSRTSPQDAPFTNDFYRNIAPYFLSETLNASMFTFYLIERARDDHDIYFAGVKG